MPALLLMLIPQLIQAGVELAPILIALVNTHDKLEQSDRPDVDDATLAALRSLITEMQAKIDAAGGLATGAPTELTPT